MAVLPMVCTILLSELYKCNIASVMSKESLTMLIFNKYRLVFLVK